MIAILINNKLNMKFEKEKSKHNKINHSLINYFPI